MPYVIAIYIVLLLALAGVLTYGFVSFDRLLRVQYERHRETWEADGRAAGFFWRAPECTILASKMARLRIEYAWLFRTPKWVADSPQLTLQLRRHRLAVLIWNIGILALWASSFDVFGRFHEKAG